MILFGRKFFVLALLVLPTLACALPNFAALAPEPTVTAQLADSSEEQGLSSEPVEVKLPPVKAPDTPDLIEMLPTLNNEEFLLNQQDGPLTLNVGAAYWINEPVELNFELSIGRPNLLRLSEQVTFDLTDLNNQFLTDFEVIATDQGVMYLVVEPPSFLKIFLKEITNPLRFQLVEMGESEPKILAETGFVSESDLQRTGITLEAEATYVAIIQPDATLDAVVELYDTAGIRNAKDDGGVGAAEIIVFSTSESAEWALVTYSFQNTAGNYSIEVFEIR
ncbi:MAG: hypothetical protein AAGD96_16825 [Chloroflexota bacterium]